MPWADDEGDVADLNVHSLKALLRQRGLAVGGVKAVLVARLEQWADRVSSAGDEPRPRKPTVALYLRGACSCALFLGILFIVGYSFGVELFAALALGVQLVVFALHAFPNNSEKFYDLTGSATHLALVLASCLLGGRREWSPRQLFVAVASSLWLSRLGTYLYSRILRDGKDERFDALKPVWVSFLGAWCGQAVWVMFIQLPVVLLNGSSDTAPATTLLDVAGMLLWFVGFAFEVAADTQKIAFRSRRANKKRWISTGLWRYSRHPNYFGEILMWSSMALVASSAPLAKVFDCAASAVAAADLGALASCAGGLHSRLVGAWISPAFTAFLLLKVSGVPMLEALGAKKWGEEAAYVHYVKHTACVVPWWPAPEVAEVEEKKRA